MQISRSTTRRAIAVTAFIAVIFALVIQERRATRLDAELTSTQKRLQTCHEFTRQLAMELLKTEDAAKAMTRSKSGLP
jgi:hypothetical protein